MSQQVHRREFCQWNLQGLGSIALLDLLRRDGLLGQEGAVAGGLHHPPRVKRAIQICLVGGMSHIDSYDYKPELSKQQGKSLPAAVKPDIFFGKVGLLRGSDWEFRQRGESGLWVSEMFPEIHDVLKHHESFHLTLEKLEQDIRNEEKWGSEEVDPDSYFKIDADVKRDFPPHAVSKVQ